MLKVEEIIRNGNSETREAAILENKDKINFIGIETITNQMSYFYNMGMPILKIFQWLIDKNGENGKWIFLNFAQLHWKKQDFKDEYMRTNFF